MLLCLSVVLCCLAFLSKHLMDDLKGHVHACIVHSQIYMYIIQSSGNLDAQP